MSATIREERLKVATVRGGQIFLRHLKQTKTHAAILMLHGLGSNGDTFIKEGHGLANYLSEKGFSCYVPDLVAHGRSWPNLSRRLEHSVHDVITSDLPRIVEEILRELGDKPLFLIGQGFGSIQLLSAYARSELLQSQVQGFVHFNARRSVSISAEEHKAGSRWWWRSFMPALSVLRGDVPLHWTRHGSQPELRSWYRTFLNWSEGEWLDEQDQYDYGAALRQLTLPPSLYFATRSQSYLTHLSDVREFMRELGPHNGRLMILGKGDGNLRNYPGQSILQHDDAWVDHFPVVLDWLNERIGPPSP